MPQLWLRGNPIGDIKGVLFDKDGTLSNSESHLRKVALLRVSEAIKVLEEDLNKKLEGPSLKELLSLVYGLKTNGISPDGASAVASREQNIISTATVLSIFGQTWPESINLSNLIFQKVDSMEENDLIDENKRPLLPGVRCLLRKLEISGVACSIISNDTSKGIKSFLIKNSLERQFKYLWSSENSPPKPNPEAAKKLCRILNLKPSECALIGDADSDLRMAHQAGMGLILGYTAGWSTPPSLNEHQHLIHHWDELDIH